VRVSSIPISTKSLYRIRPPSTLPICLDLGTNNEKYLQDEFYLGLRQKRVSDEEMTEFMDEFMHEMSVTFPKLMIQFEASLRNLIL
jgi:malate dehydrogenase (oxaloacetate-decarboxylating)(NADP+)